MLFESAAEAHGSARRITERGGRVFVEDPATAHSSPIPASVIAATPVDAVLPLPKLFERVVAACKYMPNTVRAAEPPARLDVRELHVDVTPPACSESGHYLAG